MKNNRLLWLLAAVVILVLVLLLSYCTLIRHETPPEKSAVPVSLAGGQLLALNDAVVTGFAGTAIRAEELAPSPMGAQALAQTFIDIHGPAARILNAREPRSVWNGDMWVAPQTHAIRAADVGQVFGVAIDDASHPNIYLAATSVYGLNLVERPPHDGDDDDDDKKKGDDDDDDALPHRLHTGGPRAEWMAGQFGAGGGPSSIWRVDGRTGQVTLFATVDGGAGGPAGLGNLAYDAAHRQIFVSNLSTGLIHRLDLAGRDLGNFDHGTDGRRAAGLDAVAYDSSGRVQITDTGFNPENPATWGFAPSARRVWGLAVHDSRLYYATADGHIWSVGLKDDGDFAGDPRKEIDLPAGDAPVSDIVFGHDGAMIVAERAVIGAHFDYSPLAPSGAAHVWRFWPERPDDPKTASAWYQQPEEYAVGYGHGNRASGGGVDLAYGYRIDDKGVVTFDIDGCEDAIVFTGDSLRSFHKTPDGFAPVGALQLNGLQISPARPVRGFNAPPAISYFVNYSAQMDNANHAGSVGGVRVYRLPCTGACPLPRDADFAVNTVPPVAPPPPSNPAGCTGADCTNPPCTGPDCGPPCTGPDCGPPCTGPDCGPPCTGPDCCKGPDCTGPKICMSVEGRAVCDPASGGWVYKLTATDPLGIGIDTVSAYSRVPGVTVSNGPQIPLNPPPGVIQLSGASPGQVVTVDICGFNSADPNYLAGKPYDCCHEKIRVRVPRGVCKPNEGRAQ